MARAAATTRERSRRCERGSVRVGVGGSEVARIGEVIMIRDKVRMREGCWGFALLEKEEGGERGGRRQKGRRWLAPPFRVAGLGLDGGLAAGVAGGVGGGGGDEAGFVVVAFVADELVEEDGGVVAGGAGDVFFAGDDGEIGEADE